MRWVKHLSMAHADEAMSSVLEELGPEAYGVYWLIVESIASVMEKEKMAPSLAYSEPKWAQVAHCSVRKFRTIAQRLSKERLILCVSSDNRLKISVPNILKYKDEYSKKSGHAPDSKADTEEKADTQQKAETEASDTSPSVAPSSLKRKPGYPAGSEGWDELCEVAARARMSFDPSPQSDFCLKVWCRLNMEEKWAVIESIRQRIDCGEFGPDADPRYIPKLENYVVKKKYRESIQPRLKPNLQIVPANGKFAALRAAAEGHGPHGRKAG